MPTLNTTPGTSFESSPSFYGGRKFRTFRQRVTVTHGASIQALGFNIPAKARIINSHIRNVTTNAVSGAIGGTAPNGVALMMFPTSNAAATGVLTAAPSTASASNPAGTNGYLLAITPGTGTSETNGVTRGGPPITIITNAEPINRNPVDAFLALVPAHTSSNRVQINSAATDSGYYFGTTNAANTNANATVDVVLYCEIFDDYPTF